MKIQKCLLLILLNSFFDFFGHFYVTFWLILINKSRASR